MSSSSVAMEIMRLLKSASSFTIFWNDFCDWYVEASKISLYSDDDAEKDRVVSILMDILAESMKMMHPLLSFLTEEIWSKLPNTEGKLITTSFPEYLDARKGFKTNGILVG